tara:strand:+ start:6655 stop:7044 length:390 start_codon:yes stop_codon:yes gene_type:complete
MYGPYNSKYEGNTMMRKNSPTWPMVGGLVAAIGASLCCAGPFVLLMLGISGSWISTLTAFEPFRPYFIAVVIGLFVWAGWRVHRPIALCSEGSACALPSKRLRYQRVFWVVTVIAVLLVSSPYWLVWFT